jgi:hypothetical protein
VLLRAPVLWGVVFGGIQAAWPLGFRWLDPATVYALSLTLIAAVYIGFAVADGRPSVLAVESGVAGVFVVLAAMGSPDRRGCWCSASPAMDSRTFGRSAATMWPILDGGRRSAWSSTGSWRRSSWC